jgi:hypothetical protein
MREVCANRPMALPDVGTNADLFKELITYAETITNCIGDRPRLNSSPRRLNREFIGAVPVSNWSATRKLDLPGGVHKS